MSGEQAKSNTAPPAEQTTHPPAIPQYPPQPFPGAPYPPPPGAYTWYYPPPADPNGDPSGPPPGPYVMFPPPGIMYGYPPPPSPAQGMSHLSLLRISPCLCHRCLINIPQGYAFSAPTPTVITRAKRKQVKMAVCPVYFPLVYPSHRLVCPVHELRVRL